MCHVHKGGVLSQFLDRDAPVSQYSLFTVNKGDGAAAGSGICVTVIECDITRVIAEGRDTNRTLLFSAFDQGQSVGFAV